MIVTCPDCLAQYDDEFRWTMCPHQPFQANDGKGNFAYHHKSFLSTDPTTQRDYTAPLYKPDPL